MAVETDDDQNNVTKRYKSIEDNKKTSTSGNNGAVSMGQLPHNISTTIKRKELEK